MGRGAPRNLPPNFSPGSRGGSWGRGGRGGRGGGRGGKQGGNSKFLTYERAILYFLMKEDILGEVVAAAVVDSRP